MLFRIQQNSRFRSLLSIFQSKFATVNPRFDHERKISSSLLYTTAKEDKRTDYRTFLPCDSIHNPRQLLSNDLFISYHRTFVSHLKDVLNF